MSEEKPKEDPKEEVRKTLKGILALVEKKKAAAKTSASPSKPWGWVMGLILTVLVFVALAFAAWQAWKKGREIAKLKHKIDVDVEARMRAAVQAKLKSSKEEQARVKREALALRIAIEKDREKIKKLEEERKAIHAKIEAVTSWEDLDNL